jgi:hypothetical protein
MSFNPWKAMVAVSFLVTCSLVPIPAISQNRGLPVTVVNGSTQPVPTAAQGTTNVAGVVSLSSGSTVNIGNTPSVNVSNTPSVNVTNTPTVNVANTPTVSLATGAGVNVTNPLDAQNNPIPLATLEAVQPYEDFCFMGFNYAGYGQCSFQALPANKRLVIQEFDALGELQSGSKPIYIRMYSANINFGHSFAATFMGTGFGADNFVTHQETRLYFGPNTTPNCFVAITPASSSSYTCSLSGFLVDAP